MILILSSTQMPSALYRQPSPPVSHPLLRLPRPCQNAPLRQIHRYQPIESTDKSSWHHHHRHHLHHHIISHTIIIIMPPKGNHHKSGQAHFSTSSSSRNRRSKHSKIISVSSVYQEGPAAKIADLTPSV